MPSFARLGGAVLACLSLACASAPKHDPAADQQAIRDIVTQWNGYLQSKNDSAIGALYAADAVLMPPNMPPVKGAEQARAFFAQIWAMNGSLTLTTDAVEVSGDLATERGTWTWSNPTPDGGTATDNGGYLVSWRRENGQWKAVNDIWNSHNPPPPAPPAAK